MKRKFFKTKEQRSALARGKPVGREEKGARKKKKLVAVFLLLLVFAAMVYIFIYSPIFRIDRVVVNGINEVENINAVQIGIKEYTRGYKFFIWPRDNILFLNKQRLADFLAGRARVDELKIKKKLGKTLEVQGKDRLPVFLWREGEQAYYLEKTGVVAAAVSEDKIKYNLLTIGRSTSTPVAVGENIIDPGDIDFLLAAWQKIKNNFRDWKVKKIEVPGYQSREANFYTTEGWYLIIPMDNSLDKALADLAIFLQSDKVNRGKLQYVDLRIPDKIFYK